MNFSTGETLFFWTLYNNIEWEPFDKRLVPFLYQLVDLLPFYYHCYEFWGL